MGFQQVFFVSGENMKKLALLSAMSLLSFNAYSQCTSSSTSGDGRWEDVVDESGTIFITHDVVLDTNITVDNSIVVCGKLSAIGGSITFNIANDPQGDTGTGPNYSDVGLWVHGEIDIQAPKVTPWLDVTAKEPFQTFQYGITRATAISDGSTVLASEPVGWQVGDNILVTTERGAVEKTTLTSINGRNITFDSALIGYALEFNGKTVYPKIANLSRRFVISSTGIKAHTVYTAGATVNIQNVEFRNLGPRAKLGRYPVHFHNMGASTVSVSGNSIWGDEPGNRAITIHNTQNASVTNNVIYNIQGHAVFMEARGSTII